MSRIKRVTVTRFKESLKNVKDDDGGFDILYGPNTIHQMTLSATTIETDDGAKGSMWGVWAWP